MIDNTPMQRAIQDIEARYKDTTKPGPICRARINCATCFNKDKQPTFVVGTDFGVYVSHGNESRNWTKVIGMVRITQIAVLEEFSILLLISSGSLIAYPLDVITELRGHGLLVAMRRPEPVVCMRCRCVETQGADRCCSTNAECLSFCIVEL